MRQVTTGCGFNKLAGKARLWRPQCKHNYIICWEDVYVLEEGWSRTMVTIILIMFFPLKSEVVHMVGKCDGIPTPKYSSLRDALFKTLLASLRHAQCSLPAAAFRTSDLLERGRSRAVPCL